MFDVVKEECNASLASSTCPTKYVNCIKANNITQIRVDLHLWKLKNEKESKSLLDW